MGEFFALFSAVCFAAANVTITRGAREGGQDNGAFLSILLTALVAFTALLVAGNGAAGPAPDVRGLMWFAVAGVLTAFIGRVFLFASVQRIGAIRASAVKRLNPFFAVLLGVWVLGETVGGMMLPGMVLIFLSFALLAHDSLRAPQQASPGAPKAHPRTFFATLVNLGYLYGPISALAYAWGYLARKQGLMHIPDPYLGTMVGALAGTLAYLLAAAFLDSYRKAVVNTFMRFNGWFMVTGMLASFGQLSYFVALQHSTVSRVALIVSMEVFLTIFFSVWIFRTRERLNAVTVAAACLGVAGSVLILVH